MSHSIQLFYMTIKKTNSSSKIPTQDNEHCRIKNWNSLARIKVARGVQTPITDTRYTSKMLLITEHKFIVLAACLQNHTKLGLALKNVCHLHCLADRQGHTSRRCLLTHIDSDFAALNFPGLATAEINLWVTGQTSLLFHPRSHAQGMPWERLPVMPEKNATVTFRWQSDAAGLGMGERGLCHPGSRITFKTERTQTICWRERTSWRQGNKSGVRKGTRNYRFQNKQHTQPHVTLNLTWANWNEFLHNWSARAHTHKPSVFFLWHSIIWL